MLPVSFLVIIFLSFLDLGLAAFLWLGHVRCNKELSKEEKERKDVSHVSGHNSQTNIGASRGQQVSALRHHGDKLEQLHQGQARLPPNRERLAGFGNLGVHADKVVSVHDGVNESIQDNRKVNVTIVVDTGVEPVKQENGQVMVHVQKTKLTPLLAEDDKDGIPKVPDLGNVKQPEKVRDRRVRLVVLVAGQGRVVVTVGQHETLNRHVRAEHDLGNVVDKLDRIRINRWNTQLHDACSNNNKRKIGQGNVECRGKVRQQPSLSECKRFKKRRVRKKDGFIGHLRYIFEFIVHCSERTSV
jgi:hypothetical protein